MPLDYIGIAAAVGAYTYSVVWLCRLISDLRRPEDD